MHQHIFKVGWLLTKRLQTTTTLYYTFFLPGVVLHEFVYWFVAGMLNVRAERAIAWPEAQQIAELRLNFIRLARNTGKFKLAIIGIAPFVGGMAVVWLITMGVLNLDEFLHGVQQGQYSGIGEALGALLATPDFFLWLYIAFTISNTMMPNMDELRGWKPIVIGAVVIVVILALLGVADEVVMGAVYAPLADALNLLAATFAVVIGIDLFVLGVLGAMESVIERITGDSATFQNGKLITMTREEMKKLREQERAKRARREAKRPALPAGPPSVYQLPFPIPEPPGKEAVTQPGLFETRPEQKATLPPAGEGRSGAAVVTGSVIARESDTAEGEFPTIPVGRTGTEQKADKIDANLPEEADEDTDKDDEMT